MAPAGAAMAEEGAGISPDARAATRAAAGAADAARIATAGVPRPITSGEAATSALAAAPGLARPTTSSPATFSPAPLASVTAEGIATLNAAPSPQAGLEVPPPLREANAGGEAAASGAPAGASGMTVETMGEATGEPEPAAEPAAGPEGEAMPAAEPRARHPAPPSLTASPHAEPSQPATGGVTTGLTSPSPTSAPEARPSPQRPAPTTPAQQIMPVLVTLAGGGAGGSVTVTLDPMELGRVEIAIRKDGDARARVQVVAERPETLLLLMRDQPALDRALAQAGVGLEGRSLSFDLSANDHRQQGGRPDAEGRGERGGRAPGSIAAPGASRADSLPRRGLPTSALDIAV